MLSVVPESSLLLFSDLAADLAGHTHHHAAGRHLHAFGHDGAGGNHRSGSHARAVQHDRADADDALILNGATVQHHEVTDGDAAADDERKIGSVAMQYRVVLNAGLVTDANPMHVATSHGAGPEAGALADSYVSDDLGAGINISGVGNLRQYAAISTNHAFVIP